MKHLLQAEATKEIQSPALLRDRKVFAICMQR
jgi:hypothetical protein